MGKRRQVIPFCDGCKSYHLQEHAKPGCDAFDEQEEEKDAVFAIGEMGRYKRERDKAEGRVKLLDDSLARMILQRDSERQTVRVLREKVSRLESEAKELQTTAAYKTEWEVKALGELGRLTKEIARCREIAGRDTTVYIELRKERDTLHLELDTLKEDVEILRQGQAVEVAELNRIILEKVDLQAKAIGDRAVALERAEELEKEVQELQARGADYCADMAAHEQATAEIQRDLEGAEAEAKRLREERNVYRNTVRELRPRLERLMKERGL